MTLSVLNPHFTANQGGYSRDRAITVYDRMRATSAVCVNDHEMARYILTRGGRPIYRHRAPDDDDGDSHIDPIEYVDTAHTHLSVAEDGIAGASLKGVIHIGNELGSSQPTRTDQWLEAAIRRASYHKRRAVAANWSIFNPAPNMHAALVKTYAAIRDNGGWMGYHEGALIVPETGEVIRSFEECLSRGAIGGYRDAMRQYGFRVAITEFAASKTPVDGWSTWMSEAEFATLCNKSAQFYASEGVLAHVFTCFKWDRGTGFEYVENTALQNSWAETNRLYPVKENTVPPVPPVNPPTTPKVRATLTRMPGSYINVRSQPDSSQPNDVGDLLIGDVCDVQDASPDNGWWYVTPTTTVPRPSGRQPAAQGWTSKQGGDVVFTPEAPPEPPSTVTLTEAQAEAMDDYLARAIDDMTAARQILKEAAASSGGNFRRD